MPLSYHVCQMGHSLREDGAGCSPPPASPCLSLAPSVITPAFPMALPSALLTLPCPSWSSGDLAAGCSCCSLRLGWFSWAPPHLSSRDSGLLVFCASRGVTPQASLWGPALLYDTYLGFRTRSSFRRGTVGCGVPLMLLRGAHHRPQAGWEWSPWPPGLEPAETGLYARLTVSWHLVAWARDLLIHHPCAGFPQHSWCPARAWSMSEGAPESMTRAITGNLGGCGVVAHYVFFLTLPLPAAPPASRKYSVGP